MSLEYFYCNNCGFEDMYVYVEYDRTVANGDICICPTCGEGVLIDENDKIE